MNKGAMPEGCVLVLLLLAIGGAVDVPGAPDDDDVVPVAGPAPVLAPDVAAVAAVLAAVAAEAEDVGAAAAEWAGVVVKVPLYEMR